MRFLYYFFPLLVLVSFKADDHFRNEQKKYERVRKAYEQKEAYLKKLCKEKDIQFADQEIFLRAFKKEGELEVWSKNKGDSRFIFLKKYSICSSSGNLGPKRKNGDRQVPEGFYHIDRWNPSSSFYLSLGINYPNASDRILGKAPLGGDIFIHGSCVTIGCIPVTDDYIKELYILFTEAKNAGQSKVHIHLFPCRMTEENMGSLKKEYSHDSSLLKFWQNLQPGYNYFEKNKSLPKITIEENGAYKVN